ncbi:hypothetical protein HS7_09410 [Sulfolobales archaeon HS-7]|nr:hypothetical protein HS7_09410 [Sulfolobales archaeon HS-7]
MRKGKIVTMDGEEVIISVRIKSPRPGQFVTLILPGIGEFPFLIADYKKGNLKLKIHSRKIREEISNRKVVYIKGPLGSPIKIGRSVLLLGENDSLSELEFIINYCKSKGIKLRIENNMSVKGEEDTVIITSPDYARRADRKRVYVYFRNVKMNCMLGVCGECLVGGKLVCKDGPFLKI